MAKETKIEPIPCGGCKYQGWKGLARWCRHPVHLGPMPAGRCRDYLPWETMVVEGHEAPWPMPVQLYPREV
jgi:hypothetical protein